MIFGLANRQQRADQSATMLIRLLDKGAEINEQGGAVGNALQAASARGHVQIVKLLLNKVETTAMHSRLLHKKAMRRL